jgi:glycosyltransferase involved in cell wall biosynthesis
LLPSGINTQLFKPCEVTKNPRQVIFCGGISLKKGAHHLLEAAINVQSRGVEVVLLGSTSAEMCSILDNKTKNVEILPPVQRSELPRIYSGGGCFVLPSLEEGLPKVTLEAMACGLPVITTENAAGEDLVEEGRTGFIIPAGDVDLLSEKMLWMADHPIEADAMGKRGLAKVEQNFTEKKYYERFKDALSEICKSA